MIEHEIVLGHVVSSNGIEVDKAKIDVVVFLPYPASVREVRSFWDMQVSITGLLKTFQRLELHCSNSCKKMCHLNSVMIARRRSIS